MTSPFPGMDPYAERSDVWEELHDRLMIYVCDSVQELLPEHYIARLSLRIYTETDPGPPRPRLNVPDLEVARRPVPVGAPAPHSDETEALGYWIDAPELERREVLIELHRMPGGELVTAVELLSPSNKRGRTGRDEYLRKQRDFLAAGVNLVEIDLLRAGRHMVAAPLDSLSHLPPYDYLISVRHAQRGGRFQVIPFRVRDPLPPLPVPLGAGDSPLRIELQPLFARAYRAAAVPKLVDYEGETEPPLRPDDAEWADALLRQAGIRGGGDA